VLEINAVVVKYMTIFAMPEIVTLGHKAELELRTAKYPPKKKRKIPPHYHEKIGVVIGHNSQQF